MMKGGFNYKKLIEVLNSLFMMVGYTAFYAFCWEHFYNNFNPEVNFFFRRGNYIMYAVYIVLLYIFLHIYDGLRFSELRTGELITAQVLALICTNALTYVQILLMTRAMLSPIPLIVELIVGTLFMTLWTIIIKRCLNGIFPPSNTIIVHGGDSGELLKQKMAMRTDKYNITASITAELPLEEILEHIKEYEAVVICDLPNELRNDILKFCFERRIVTYVSPKLSDIILRGAEEFNSFDSPLLRSKKFTLTLEQRFIKRCLDILLSLIAIVIASPFMLISALLVKLNDGGHVFYKQERLTFAGRRFNVLKFRSMVENAEQDGVARLSEKNDSRITPIGGFLRKIRFDELPQLLNILKGDMSFVGPRPERPEIAAQYQAEMPEFAFRLNAKAGLTGYAQVMGKYNTTPYDKLKLDLIYIEQYSLLLDLRLMFKTVRTVITPEATEGIDKGETTAQKRKKQ